MSSSKAKDRLLSKDYILIMFSATAYALMNHFFLATAPLYVSKLGGSAFQAGMLATVYSMTALAARPISGALSDKSGRVKMLVAGALICAATCAVIGFVSSIPLLLVIRAVAGVGFGMLSTCAGAAAADVLPKSRLAEGIGYFSLYSTAAQAIGPGIALMIIAGDRISDYRTLYIMTAGLCAASAASSCCITYERKRKRHASGEPGASAGADMPADSAAPEPGSAPGGAGLLPKTLLGFEYAVFAPAAVLMLAQIGLSGISVFMSQFARWKDFGNPGLYFTVTAVGTLLSRLFFGKVADRRGSDIIIIPALAVLTACIALIPAARSMSVLVAMAFPVGIAQGAVLPTINSMLFKRCSPARRGTASGAYFAALDLGFAIGAPLLGAVAGAFDYNFIYWASAASTAVAMLLYMMISTDRRHNMKAGVLPQGH